MGTRHRKRQVLAAAGTAVLTTGGALLGGTAPGAAAPPETPKVTVTPWLTHLNAPRGVTFDGDGSFYVAESGLAGKGKQGLTHTGRVSKYHLGSTRPVWQHRFASLYASLVPGQPPDVLGPEGMSALGHGCGGEGHRGDSSVRHRDDCQVFMVTSESNKGTGAPDPQIGRLFRIDTATGSPTAVSDVGNQQWRFTKRHPNTAEPKPDSNPYAVLVTRKHDRTRVFVVDAGANTVSEITRRGRTRVIALIPNDTPKHDSAPTCVAMGPDGNLYVATLSLVVNAFGMKPGHSNVWRVDPDASYPTRPKIWARGLTTPTACTFDREGNFWAAEMFYPHRSGAPGDLVKIPFEHPTRQTHLGGGRIPLPGGIVQGPDNAFYVSINSAAPGPAGAVVRVRIHD